MNVLLMLQDEMVTSMSQSLYFLMNSSRVGSLEGNERPGSDELRPGEFFSSTGQGKFTCS